MRHLPFSSLLIALLVACATPPVAAPTPAPAAEPVVQGTLLEGVVRDASGQPVEDAWVALIPTVREWRPGFAPPAARVKSTQGGRFRIEGAPAGTYGLSATAPGHAALYRTGVKLEKDARMQGVELALGKDGVLLQGVVKDRKGQPLADAWVALSRVSDNDGDVAYVRADAQGAYATTLPPGSTSCRRSCGAMPPSAPSRWR